MSGIAPKLVHGFERAVLGEKVEANPMTGAASAFPEMPQKRGYFLISKEAPDNPPQSNKGGKQAVPKKTRNRKSVTRKGVFEYRGKNYRVNAAKSGLYVESLRSIIKQFELASQKWGRVFVLRFDLHQHVYTGNSERVTAFRDRLVTRLKYQYGFKEVGYCWAREMERAKTQHYHFVLFLDGRLIRHSNNIIEMVKRAWDDGTGTYTIPTISRPYYFGSGDEITDKVIYRISYLAKARGKGFRNKQAKDVICSRLKP